MLVQGIGAGGFLRFQETSLAALESKQYRFMLKYICIIIAKQKHPGCKKSARSIRSSIANRYVRPKTLISVEAKKLLNKNLFNYLNDIQ